MSPRSFSSFTKRQKERARKEKQQEKQQRRFQRGAERARPQTETPEGLNPAEPGETAPAASSETGAPAVHEEGPNE